MRLVVSLFNTNIAEEAFSIFLFYFCLEMTSWAVLEILFVFQDNGIFLESDSSLGRTIETLSNWHPVFAYVQHGPLRGERLLVLVTRGLVLSDLVVNDKTLNIAYFFTYNFPWMFLILLSLVVTPKWIGILQA